jgi:hypothetical protein
MLEKLSKKLNWIQFATLFIYKYKFFKILNNIFLDVYIFYKFQIL